jgi:hypothetical protein
MANTGVSDWRKATWLNQRIAKMSVKAAIKRG